MEYVTCGFVSDASFVIYEAAYTNANVDNRVGSNQAIRMAGLVEMLGVGDEVESSLDEERLRKQEARVDEPWNDGHEQRPLVVAQEDPEQRVVVGLGGRFPPANDVVRLGSSQELIVDGRQRVHGQDGLEALEEDAVEPDEHRAVPDTGRLFNRHSAGLIAKEGALLVDFGDEQQDFDEEASQDEDGDGVRARQEEGCADAGKIRDDGDAVVEAERGGRADGFNVFKVRRGEEDEVRDERNGVGGVGEARMGDILGGPESEGGALEGNGSGIEDLVMLDGVEVALRGSIGSA